MLRGRLGGDGGNVAGETQCRARLGQLIGSYIRHDEALARARQRPLQKTSEHGVPIGNVDGRILRSATTPRERPKDVAETKETPVDGARFAKARVARSWLRRACSIRPFRSREVDERERAREPILAVVAVQLHTSVKVEIENRRLAETICCQKREEVEI